MEEEITEKNLGASVAFGTFFLLSHSIIGIYVESLDVTMNSTHK